jgi:succinate dehydrogenase/fumarate reductase-like Fe-S protein
MQHTLNIRAFFFNAKTDYLPYYKNFSMTLDADASVVEILANVQAQNEDFAYPSEKLLFKLNDVMLDGTQTIAEVVAKLGDVLQIDPALSYRSNHCLVLNDSDFMQSFERLAPYASDEDKTYYESLYALHYASESFKFSHDYIGDAILLLAHKMIEEGSEHKEAILAAISDPYDGLAACEYENNLFDAQDHTQTIEALNAMVKHPSQSNFLDKIAASLSKKALPECNIDSVAGLKVACYSPNTEALARVKDAILNAEATVVPFARESKLCGRTLLGKQENLAYLKAATTLLEAFDAGSSLLVVTDPKDLEMFETHFASLQKRIGREINLPMVNEETFLTLCSPKTQEVVA